MPIRISRGCRIWQECEYPLRPEPRNPASNGHRGNVRLALSSVDNQRLNLISPPCNLTPVGNPAPPSPATPNDECARLTLRDGESDNRPSRPRDPAVFTIGINNHA